MKRKRQLQELTIKDNFMFGAVMNDEENCRGLLELVLDIPIKTVKVSREKSIVYHPEYKGVRLDVYAEDEQHTHYNVEMQVARKQELGRRSRYYHSQIDMELMLSGTGYAELPDVYVIFICDFDPFGERKYRYTFRHLCQENQNLGMQDGSITIFLSTRGENRTEVPEALARFLDFVRADAEGAKNFEDVYIQRLQDTIRRIKSSREMEERFMILEEMLKDERAEGRAEGKAEGKAESILLLLQELGTVPDGLAEKIMNEKNPVVLNMYLQYAAKAESLQDFVHKLA